MKNRLNSLFFGAAIAAMLAGCMGELGDEEWADNLDEDVQASPYDDEKTPADVEKTYLGHLGGTRGSPVVTGSTGGLSNDYLPTCISYSAAPDASYTWTAPHTGQFVFDTMGSAFDTVLEIRRYNDSVSLGCNDDSGGTLQSSVSVNLSAGQTVMVVIDGYGAATGTYRLSINGLAACSPPSGWNLADWDWASRWMWSYASAWYTGEQGMSRWNWPALTQLHATLTNSDTCSWDKDKRLYFTDPYFANPDNDSNVRVRYLPGASDPGIACRGLNWEKKPIFDYYMTSEIDGIPGPYVRVTLGEHCPHTNVLLVAW